MSNTCPTVTYITKLTLLCCQQYSIYFFIVFYKVRVICRVKKLLFVLSDANLEQPSTDATKVAITLLHQ